MIERVCRISTAYSFFIKTVLCAQYFYGDAKYTYVYSNTYRNGGITMRKKLSFLLIAVMLISICGISEPVKASGREYVYREVSDGFEASRKAWFVNGEEITGNPDVIEEQSQVTIETTPDDSCAAYLATFYEPTTRVTVCPGVTVTFGSTETASSIQWLTCYNADVTVYAEEGKLMKKTEVFQVLYMV